MSFLVVLKEGRPFLRFRMENDETTIGRGTQADLYIPDARISRVHSIVKRETGGFKLLDRSTNGTFLNGVRTRVARLQDQDIITVGSCQILFEAGDETEPPSTVLAVPEGGALSYDSHLERFLYAKPVLWVRDGLGQVIRHPIRREIVSIGSSEANDLVLPDAQAHHCQLLATSDGYTLRSLFDNASVVLDDAPVRNDTPVRYGSTIRIGRADLQLVLEEGEDPLIPMNVSLFEGMVGTTAQMRKLFSLIERFARHDAPVIVLGETGTGKELVARALHQRGHRSRGPFVALNCSAISPQLFESELFGHQRGAFTGAIRDQVGALEAAHGGTLFLDELGDMPLELQAKLLRVLESSRVTPVGSHQPRPVDVRVVAATNKDLQKEVEDGRFRADLFFRLFVLTVELPPLRERREDIPSLVAHFLQSATVSGPPPRITPEATERLMSYHWPGNIRELRHVLIRALASGDQNFIAEDMLQFLGPMGSAPSSGTGSGPGRIMKLEEMEMSAIKKALNIFRGNRKEAAHALGIARSTLHVRMKKHGLIDDGDEDA